MFKWLAEKPSTSFTKPILNELWLWFHKEDDTKCLISKMEICSGKKLCNWVDNKKTWWWFMRKDSCDFVELLWFSKEEVEKRKVSFVMTLMKCKLQLLKVLLLNNSPAVERASTRNNKIQQTHTTSREVFHFSAFG